MRVERLLLCLIVVAVALGAPTNYQTWPTTLDDKPFELQKFGDSNGFKMEPMFNKSTYAFIKNVLDGEVQPQMPSPAQQPAGEQQEQGASKQVKELSSHPQPWVDFEKLRAAFVRQDLDESGALELTEAKSIFDSFRIHFETIEELNSYFGTDGMMSYVEYLNLLANKGVIGQDNAQQGKVEYAKSIGLDEKDVQDAEAFRVKQKAVVWLKKYLADVNNVGVPFPDPPVSASGMDVAKQAIVRYVIRTTGRTDAVTYENAHLSKEKVDEEEQKRNPTFFCHPAKMETCTIGQPCCGELRCCPTGNGSEGFCTDQCMSEQVVEPTPANEGAEPTFAALTPNAVEPAQL